MCAFSKRISFRWNETGRAEIFYDQHALLGTLARRIALTWLLGLIDKKTKNDLDRIRRIRNVFAHRIHDLRFSHPQIAEICRKLDTHGTDATKLTPREQFLISVSSLNVRITERHAADLMNQIARVVAYLKTIDGPAAKNEVARLEAVLRAERGEPQSR